MTARRTIPAVSLLLAAGLGLIAAPETQAGPLLRRAQGNPGKAP